MPKKSLVFIDTNIFLDFYRLRGAAVVRQLQALRRHRSSLILTDQVRMEFLKNRQNAVADIWKEVPAPVVNLPAVLRDEECSIKFVEKITEAKRYHKEIQKKALEMLQSPRESDVVYREVEGLFSERATKLLSNNSREYDRVHARAKQRFDLGYPPRKDKDRSIGDALNWEWIIECASAGGSANVTIVSRDGDFEGGIGQKSALNDFLRDEFDRRVGNGGQLRLTQKLTDALEVLEESVAAEDREAEENLIKINVRMDALRASEFRKYQIEKELTGQLGRATNYSVQFEKAQLNRLLEKIRANLSHADEVSDDNDPQGED